MGRSMIVVAGVALLLSGCGTQKPLSERQALDGNPLIRTENPYLRIAIYDDEKICGSHGQKLSDKFKNDYYLTLSATYSPREGDRATRPPLSYDAADRMLIPRFLDGRNVSFTLLANIKVDDATIPIPLYAMSHNSNTQDGETFALDLSLISHDHYIRVSDTTPVDAEFSASYSDTYQSNILGLGVQLAKTAVKAISPDAHVLTTLNKKSLQQEAALWDKTLSTAMGKSVGEKVPVGITAQQLSMGGCGIIALSIPGPGGDMDPTVEVGQWRVGANNRISSLFIANDDLDGTSDPGKTVAATRILNTYIGISEEQTIERYLKGSTVNDALTGWSAATKDTDTAKQSGQPPQAAAAAAKLKVAAAAKAEHSAALKAAQAAKAAAPKTDPATTPDPSAAATNAAAVEASDKELKAAYAALAAAETDAAAKAKAAEDAVHDAFGKEDAAAAAVCRGAIDTLYGLGLSSVDARLGLWAMLVGMSLPGNPPDWHVLRLQETCTPKIAPFTFAAARS